LSGVNFPKPYADRVAKLRVFFGFLLVAAFVWLARPYALSIMIGLPVSALGLALRAWAAGHLEKNLALTESGPYARVRNPLYLGTLTAAAGLALAAWSWELAVLFAAVFLLVYLPVVELEEQHLRSLFPGFAEYATRVPRLRPHLGHIKSAGKQFRWSTYRKNREYEALAAFLAGVAEVSWKEW
jgi:protein-S-isoprenylcysteine O-methyltransferase Ste14